MSSRLMSGALTSLTRRVGVLNLGAATKKPSSLGSFASYTTIGTGRLLVPKKPTSLPSSTSVTATDSYPLPVLGTLNAMDGPFWQIGRSVTRKKRLERRRKRKAVAREEAKVQDGKPAVKAGDDEIAAPQHEAWVEFQKSISVKGFQTGQVTKARVMQKGESGMQLRDLKRHEKMEMRLAAKRPELADVRGGEYPTKRYSDEETERLLKMAYAAIPPRAGKRGTRNLKRQKNRWFLVRKIHRKSKLQNIAAHFRKMEERSRRKQEIREVQSASPDARAEDREYQRQVLRRWVQNLRGESGDYAEQEVIQAHVVEEGSKA